MIRASCSPCESSVRPPHASSGAWTACARPSAPATIAAAPNTPVFFHGKRHAAEMGAPEITRFLIWLAVHGKVAAATQNQALGAVLFRYREGLELDVAWLDGLVRARRPPACVSRTLTSGPTRSSCGLARVTRIG